MRIERHDARPQPGPPRRVDHPEVAEVDAVERPDRDGAPRLRQLRRAPERRSRAQPRRAASTRASTSASARSRSAVNASGATASATENGPTSVRRSVAQCPPSAIAIDRTYVPELTRASSVTLSPVYAMTSSACTVERRTGISTSTPRRASLYARSPPIFTADAAGIGSSISPRRRSSRSLELVLARRRLALDDLPLRIAGRGATR